MMQHRGLTGRLIGAGRPSGFEETERRIRMERIASGVAVTHADSPWFALRCWTGRETAVDNNLKELGVTALVPMRKGPDLRRRGRVIEGRMMPVIHGYVLVQMDASPVLLDALKAVEHVIEVLGGCLNPKRLSAAEVNDFRAMAERGVYDWERDRGVVFVKDEKVRIVDGLFGGLIGVVVSARNDRRGDAVVSIDVMGRETPVTLPLAMLEKI